MGKESKSIRELKHKARRYSIKEGIFASIKTGFGDHYISPFAIAINASNFMIAMLGSISGLLGPLSQMFGSKLMEKHSRKKIVIKLVFFEALMWLPLILIAVLYYKNIIPNILPILFLIAFSMYVIISNIPVPAWFSWLGDIVDEEFRGRWFSKRNIITGFISGTFAIIASFFLEYTKKQGMLLIGFAILFSIALIARLISWRIYKKKYEPKIKLKRGYYFSFAGFLADGLKTNFGKFAVLKSLMNFAISISAPLLAVYLLRNLELGYTSYIIISLAQGLYSILVMNLWGRFADKYGNYKILYITSFLMPIIPILWILNKNPFYLIFVPSMIAGISSAGLNLATGNFIYDNVSKEKRGLAISYYNMLNGIGIFLGAGLGAILIKYLATAIEPIILIFIISGIARGIVAIWWIPQVREIRKTERFDGKKAIKNLIFKDGKSILIEEAHEIMSIKEYLREK